nr:deoxyuridine 5'-triphosphate nucleotidohydrolase-like [Hydra vulgaris]
MFFMFRGEVIEDITYQTISNFNRKCYELLKKGNATNEEITREVINYTIKMHEEDGFTNLIKCSAIENTNKPSSKVKESDFEKSKETWDNIIKKSSDYKKSEELWNNILSYDFKAAMNEVDICHTFLTDYELKRFDKFKDDFKDCKECKKLYFHISTKKMENKSDNLQEALNYLNSTMKIIKIRDQEGWCCYATKGSAGFDLRSIEKKMLMPFQRDLFSTGVSIIEMDYSLQGQIAPKSGLAWHNGITVLNAPGIIDADYKDEIKDILFNSSGVPFSIERGQAIAQMTFVPVFKAEKLICKRLNGNIEMEFQSMISEEERTGGFGSTGH